MCADTTCVSCCHSDARVTRIAIKGKGKKQPPTGGAPAFGTAGNPVQLVSGDLSSDFMEIIVATFAVQKAKRNCVIPSPSL